MPMRHAPSGVRAFTLVELLVVISIISLLIALLLPMLSASQQVARMTTCAANQRQIGLAFAQYSTDDKNDACHPLRGAPTSNGYRMDLLEIYLERGAYPASGLTTRVFSNAYLCPDNPSPVFPDVNGGYSQLTTSYRGNQHLVVSNPTASSGSQIVDVARMNRIGKPSSKISMVEARITYSSAGVTARGVASDSTTNQGFFHMGRMNAAYANFVDGRMNVLFLDGHSQTYAYPDAIFKTNVISGTPAQTVNFSRYYEPRSGQGGL